MAQRGNGGQGQRTRISPSRPTCPRAYPYGIYDLGRNAGFVNVGTDHDTGAFAVASIRGWWRAEGRHLYLRPQQLLITPMAVAAMAGDCGYGNGIAALGRPDGN